MKVIGTVVGVSGVSLFLLSQKSARPSFKSDDVSKKTLIIDENAEQYIYKNGYIVEASR